LPIKKREALSHETSLHNAVFIVSPMINLKKESFQS
jgi:hypothetical protein